MKRGLAVGALLACAPSLAAQDASILLGGSRAQYADTVAGNAGLLGLRLGLGRGPRSVQFDAAMSRFTGGGWALQLSGQGSALWPLGRGTVLAGLAAGASVNDVEDGSATGTGAGGPMLMVRTTRAQFVVGAAAGSFRALDRRWAGIGSASARGYWAPHPRILLGVGGTGILADSLRFADLSLHAQMERGPVRVSVLGGTRVGDLADGPWGSVEVSIELLRRVVLEASGGRYPQDVTGFTDGVYAQAGIRLFALRAPAPFRVPPPAVSVRRIEAERARVELRYRADVASLQLAGDWNGWTPFPLRHTGDGLWVADIAIRPGTYGFALLADGEWVLPDGVTGVDDGFGGRVGRLIVPR